MRKNSFVSMIGCGCLAAALLLGFLLVIAPGSASAQDSTSEGEKLFETDFNVKSWKVYGYRTVTGFLGENVFANKGKFKYADIEYTITTFATSSKKKVSITISPGFPPSGARKSDFTLHLGSKGRALDQFNFGDATESKAFTNEWTGTSESLRAGFRENDHRTKNGIIKITGLPKGLGNHLQFGDYKPRPTETSGRLVVVSDLNDDENTKRWRICNRGFGKEEAQVACRQLGLGTSNAEAWDLSKTDWLKQTQRGFGAFVELLYIWSIALTPALLDNLECDGDESKLVDCEHSGLGVGNACSINNTAAVKCGN